MFGMTAVVLLALNLAQPTQIDLRLTRISDLGQVVEVKHAGDGSERLFVVEKSGQVWVFVGGERLQEPFIDVSDLIALDGSEKGLLSMAFSPDYAESGEFYLFFTDTGSRSNITRFQVSEDPDRADPDSAETVIAVIQPFDNHNGGRLEFGPDGYLYLGIGDGGSANDPLGAGQDLTTLLGKLIRIDVDDGLRTYEVPPDNPFVNMGEAARPEIWAYGLRNPWRMAFDRQTGELYIADVGQARIEEIDVQPADSPGGENYGWSIAEGVNCRGGGTACDTSGFTPPVFEYAHDEGRCSITGGQVYRGSDYPALQGLYLYGDFCTGEIWGLTRVDGQWVNQILLSERVGSILTFGEDERGELYVGISGVGTSGLYRISDGPLITGGDTGIDINAGMSGAWFDPATPGQGFLIEVAPDSAFLFLAWFTFEAAGRKLGAEDQRWLTAQGGLSGDTATLDLFLTRGGRFDDPQATSTDPAGSLSLRFQDCLNATIDYALADDGPSGSIDITRLVPGGEALCESLDAAR